MTTTTSSSKEKSRFASIYKSTVKNQVPLAIVTAIIFILLLVVTFFVERPNHLTGGNHTTAQEINRYYTTWLDSGIYMDTSISILTAVTLMVLIFVSAMMVNGYMHSKSRTDLYHSLPVTRPQMLTANFLASLTTVFGPFLGVYLITMIIQLILYGRWPAFISGYLAYSVLDLVFMLALVCIIYCFTTFVAVNVGTGFDTFALTGVLGMLPMMTYLILGGIWSDQTYGATFNERWTWWLSPFIMPFQRYDILYDDSDLQFANLIRLIRLYVICFAVAAIFFAAAVYCYKRRRSELAEQAQHNGVFQTIAKCFSAFLGAALFYFIFYRIDDLVFRIPLMIFGALFFGLVAELILSRGMHSLPKNLKWLIGAGVGCSLVIIALGLDPFGYVKRVPDPSRVASVSISYNGRFEELSAPWGYPYRSWNKIELPQEYSGLLVQPESIEVVTRMHRLAVDNVPRNTRYYYEDARFDHSYITLNYQLKNGRTISRYYNRVYVEAMKELVNLEDKADFIKGRNNLFFAEYLATDNDLYNAIRRISVYNAFGEPVRTLSLSRTECLKLLAAVQEDILGEPLDEILAPSSPPMGYLYVELDSSLTYSYYDSETTVVVTPEYGNTIRVMEELDLLDYFDDYEYFDEVRVSSAVYTLYGNVGVQFIVPDKLDNYIDSYAYYENVTSDAYVSITNPGQIDQVAGSSRSQIYFQGSDTSAQTALAVFYRDGEPISARFIDIAQLPSGYSEEALEIIKDDLTVRYGIDYTDSGMIDVSVA